MQPAIYETAASIAKILGLDVGKVFKQYNSADGLADRTIVHYCALISVVLSQAKRERIVAQNVAEFARKPKVKRKEATFLNDEEAQQLYLLLIEEPDIRVKTALLMFLFSGLRRGELCGLSWGDIDTRKRQIHVRRASQYQAGRGIKEVYTKNESSQRSVTLPQHILDLLVEYKQWWIGERFKNGSKWQGQAERLFIQKDGRPIHPQTMNTWLTAFIQKHGLRHFSPHSLRHTFASLLIVAGVDYKTIQGKTGHANMNTLFDTYAHVIKSREETATDALDDIIIPKGKETQRNRA